MEVAVIVKATASSEAGELPNEALLGAMGEYTQELVNAGILVAGEGLHPRSKGSKGVRVHCSGTKRSVTDGLFAETKELMAGYWLRTVGSRTEAIEWGKRCPNPRSVAVLVIHFGTSQSPK